MLVFSNSQFGAFRLAQFRLTSEDIARDLALYRPDKMDQADLATWVERRAMHYAESFAIQQKRHLHLLCYWELALGAARFERFRAEDLDNALSKPATERHRIETALSALRAFFASQTTPA